MICNLLVFISLLFSNNFNFQIVCTFYIVSHDISKQKLIVDDIFKST